MGNINGCKLVLRDACKDGNLREVKEMLRKYPAFLNGDDTILEPPLVIATRSRRDNILRYLYKKKELDPNARSFKNSCSALIVVASLGYEDMVRFLLADPRVDPNLQEPNDGFSALMLASYKGHTAVVAELLKCARVNTLLRSKNGKTAITLCCEHPSAMKSQKEDLQQMIENAREPEEPVVSRTSFASTLNEVEEKPILSDVFITHNWGKGNLNHQQVAKVNTALKARGIITWFDDDRMRGNVRKKMTVGIENAKCMLVCITQQYKDKVNSNDDRDNCRYEFTYGVEQLGPQRMVVLVMEPEMRNPRAWKGELGAALGRKLYHDFPEGIKDEESFNGLMDRIEEEIREIINA